MPIFQRITEIHAVQFFEKEFAENGLYYPDVWDHAMVSKSWRDKTAKEGRYYLINQPNTNAGQNEYITVNDGDYIIREEMGISYTLPKDVFEKHFKQISQ